MPKPVEPPKIDGIEHPIDRFIAAKLSTTDRAGIEPCDDATFLRRVYLDVIGAIPTVLDLNRFLADSSSDKRPMIIHQLLARRSEYAAHWTVFWEDALASQTVTSQGGIPTHGNYRQWIFNSFETNRPYDVMVAELLDPTMPRRKKADAQDILGTTYAIEYVLNDNHQDTVQTAANVAQVFLGTSMKCASCHDHFENAEWPQQRFLAFAGMFAAKDLEQIRCDVHSGKNVPARFPFELPDASADVPTGSNARLHVVALDVVDPANPRFALTIVNRLWKRYLGLGLFEPADDFRLDVPVSHPELLEWLSYDFVEHGCDLQHTIRLILTSGTYQARYDAGLEDRFDSTKPGAARYFRSPALRRLTCEQFLDSARVATTDRLPTEERAYLDSRSTPLTRALGRPASRNEVSTSRPDDVAVVQSLELMNGKELHDVIEQSTLFEKPIRKVDLPKLIDRLYRSILTRPPTYDERKLALAFLSASTTPADGVKDMMWSLLCSPEFQYMR
ncbi:MAG TPA: DUF1549 domain-containing protein [Pirellulales bacterium]|nr:DUF1549 domain-containing protein [Pirellulales bacterium]